MMTSLFTISGLVFENIPSFTRSVLSLMSNKYSDSVVSIAIVTTRHSDSITQTHQRKFWTYSNIITIINIFYAVNTNKNTFIRLLAVYLSIVSNERWRNT